MTNKEIIEDAISALADDLEIVEQTSENNNCNCCSTKIPTGQPTFVTGGGYTHCSIICAVKTILKDYTDADNAKLNYLDSFGRNILEPYVEIKP